MPGKLDGMKVALLVTHGFQQSELTEPKKALEEQGAQTFIVSPSAGEMRGWKHTDWGDSVRVDITLDATRAADYHALVLPGGVMNPDYLRWNKRAVEFVKGFFDAGKPIAAICHGPWTLIEAGVVQNRKLTSWPSLRTDLKNAGAHWVDEEVVVDDGLVTSRKPDDLPVFNQKIVEEFAKYRAQRQSAQARAS
jgi:protease I